MSVSAVKRGRDGKLRYTRDGHAYVVRADGARFYFGAVGERVYCTRDVRRFLRDEAMRGGADDGPAASGPVQEPVAGESAIELLPTDTMRNIMRRIEDPMDLASFLRTSRYMAPHAGRREWDIVANLPIEEFGRIVRILGETECVALNAALHRVAEANPIGAQYDNEEDQERAMNAWIGANNKMDVVAERIAAIQGVAGAAAPGAP